MVSTLALFAAVQPACGQIYDTEDKLITLVTVRNNKAISTETILSKVKTRVGDKFNQSVLNDDLKRLYATEYFTDVSIDVEDFENGVSVTFIVGEKPIIEDIVFKGNKAFRAQRLKSLMKSRPNEMLNLALLAQDIADMKNFYIKKGYPLVDITYKIDMDKDTNKSTVTVSIEEKTRVKVASVKIEGNKTIKSGVIMKLLSTKPAWLFNPGIFNEDVFQEDIEKIRSVYDDMGFLDTKVTPKLEYAKEGTVLNIVIEIEEGKQYLAGAVNVTGNLVLPEKDVRSQIKMAEGKPFSSRALRDDVLAIRFYYYEFGYMNVVVDVAKSLNQETGRIDITYNIDAKEPVYVGKVEIRGNLKTKDIVVRREIRIYPGDRFNGKKIKRSKERIYNLGFFENVSFDTEPTSTPDIQNLIVSVKESKTGEFSFGGGYSSIDLLVGFVEITQRNFDALNFPSFMGGGQNLSIKAEIGMVRNNYNISWTDPWFLGYPFSFGFDVYRAAHNKRGDLGWAYDEVRTGGDLRLGKEITEYLSGMLVYRLEDVKISNIIENASKDFMDEEGSNVISSLLGGLTLDTRDNVFNPGSGYFVDGNVDLAGGIFLGDKDFVKGGATAIYYHTFFEKVVLELKGRMGLSNAYGKTDEVPVYERFYAGGQNTIRGYKERRVGPRDPGSNEPIGGEAILVGNVEATFPIYEKLLKGAIFYDVGNVWRRAEDFIAGGNYRSGAGVGLRIKTPIGPVRVDYGYPLMANYDDERTGEFYFSMSRGF